MSKRIAWFALFGLAVYWQYTRYKGSASFGPLLAPGSLPPPNDPVAAGSLTGLTPAEEIAAICKRTPSLAFCPKPNVDVVRQPIAFNPPVGTGGRQPLFFI